MAQANKRKQSKSLDDSEGEAVQGRWIKEEHQRFVEALSIHGKNWKKVEEYVGIVQFQIINKNNLSSSSIQEVEHKSDLMPRNFSIDQRKNLTNNLMG